MFKLIIPFETEHTNLNLEKKINQNVLKTKRPGSEPDLLFPYIKYNRFCVKSSMIKWKISVIYSTHHI